MLIQTLPKSSYIAACGIALLLAFIPLMRTQEDPESVLKSADKAYEKKNYAEAQVLYRKFLEATPKDPRALQALASLVNSSLLLSLSGEALVDLDRHIDRVKGTALEARVQRMAGNTWLRVPHWGTRSGGEFARGVHEQGIYLDSHRHDKARAIRHLENGRELYSRFENDVSSLAILPEAERKEWRAHRIECLFELVEANASFGIYSDQSEWWERSTERDDEAAVSAGEDDFEEQHSRYESRRTRPIGIRLDHEGRPVLARLPKEYRPDLNEDQKILWLLQEIRGIDNTEGQESIARSHYVQGLLARARFGMDRIKGWCGWYWDGSGYPLTKELETLRPYDLKDDECIALAGGRVQVVKLSEDWDPIRHFRLVATDYPKSKLAAESGYSLGLYYQTREQFDAAIRAYREVIERHPKSDWASNAKNQISRIEAPELVLGDSGVMERGTNARVSIVHRNATKVWFVARRIDVDGYLAEVRNLEVDPEKGHPHFWSLQHWSNYFLDSNSRDRISRIAWDYVGPEIERWSVDIVPEPGRRYGKAEVTTPLMKAGAYLVAAYLVEPSSAARREKGRDGIQEGTTRAVVVVSDLALVEKSTAQGQLYFVCDARTGKPIPGAKVDAVEIWSEWVEKNRHSRHYRALHELVTDAQGTALLKRPSGRSPGNFHVVAKAPESSDGEVRIAWTGMRYFQHFDGHSNRSGPSTWMITDRPVYRPKHTVRYKAWLRVHKDGGYDIPGGQGMTVVIRDARGNEVFKGEHSLDSYGALDGSYVLPDGAALGFYQIQVIAASGQHFGGGGFRVEEYKKPEFEVTVEPAATQAKLGGKLKADIKAKYYFGAPVTDATVSYKVFREEFEPSLHEPGHWDWLYGVGYGKSYYQAPWMPWWSSYRHCCLAPGWWWTSCGISPPTPVRELVMQGESRIGAEGKLELEIDTAPALRDHPDRDHRYVVEVEVRDSSRRVIRGEGAVAVTRQSFFAFIDTDRGFVRPGDELDVRVRCLSPDGKPLAAEGVLSVAEILYDAIGSMPVGEKEISRETLQTDGEGRAKVRIRPEKSGQYRLRFETPDAWGGVVAGVSLLWVCGSDFTGEIYRFNELEILTDKRTYRPGETAHLLINAKESGAHVLFSDDVESGFLKSWRVLSLKGRTMALEIPITDRHRPNFFIEATTVANLRMHQQFRQICVPPEETVMNVEVRADKPVYKPGERCNVTITAKDAKGNPVLGQFLLTAFDESVLQIQSDQTATLAAHFHGSLRHHAATGECSTLSRFPSKGAILDVAGRNDLRPASWNRSQGYWGEVELLDEELGFVGGLAKDSRDGSARERSLGARSEGKAALRDSASPAPSAAAEASAPMGGRMKDDAGEDKNKMAQGSAAGPALRSRFADTAAWIASFTTASDGTATLAFEMPENLTAWRLASYGITTGTRVGQAKTSVTTSKKFLVRLQAPRFFMEKDEVVVSANVHNDLDVPKTAKVSLILGEGSLALIDGEAGREVKVAAHGEVRVDWRLKVLKEGEVEVRVDAVADTESDAMAMTFPVLVHGALRQVSATGVQRIDDQAPVTVSFDVPKERNEALTRLEIRYSPSLVGAMLDALPYCLEYPYGCTEQTMSRFLPAVQTLKTLQDLGIKLEDVKEIRGKLKEAQAISGSSAYAYSPVFDSKTLTEIVNASLNRIASMQNGDGGFGWWAKDSSNSYLTSYVLSALCEAVLADVPVDSGIIDSGMGYLENATKAAMVKKSWDVSDTEAFVGYVLSMRKRSARIEPASDDKRPAELLERLFVDRDRLGVYGKSLLALSYWNLDQSEKARLVYENILQFKEENRETQLAWIRTPTRGWWWWWNDPIEANAWFLRAMMRIEPKSDVAPRLVKWLLENRKNGYYWKSTRDTTLCVSAMAEFVRASGEGAADYTLTISIDGGKDMRKVKIDRASLLSADNRFVIEGPSIGAGKHTVTLTKEGQGALYWSARLQYFTKEVGIKASGHELKVDRRYFRLKQVEHVVDVEGSEGQIVKEKRLRYEREPLPDGATLASGELVQVELEIAADTSYAFLAIEDPKPAGCEAIDVQSGYDTQEGFTTYREMRDEKVVFFVGGVDEGRHLLRYRLRAEVPGRFHALPTQFYAMYTPELRANAAEHVLNIVDP